MISFAASSALARQIEAGAPADLFISADEEWMDDVAARRLIAPGDARTFLINSLVLVAPAASKGAEDPPGGAPLARGAGRGPPGHGRHGPVPAGKYGKEALTAARRLAGGAAQIVARRERPRGAGAGRTRRGAARHRLCDRRAGPNRGARRRRVPRRSHPPIAYPVARLTPRPIPMPRVSAAFCCRRAGKAIFCAASASPPRRRPLLLRPEEWGIVALSLRVAVWRCVVDPAARLRAGLAARPRRFPGKILLDALVHLPLVCRRW